MKNLQSGFKILASGVRTAGTCLLLLLYVASSAQTVKQLTKAGDEKYAAGDYYAAAIYYKDALQKDAENPELNYKYAEASRMYNDYKSAVLGYRAVTKYDKENKFPLAYFWLGEMLRSSCICKTKEAIREFRRFHSRYRKKDFYSAKCQQELEACAWVLDHLQKNDSIQIEHLSKEVNTEQSEFNAIPVFPDKLQFSSLRNISTDKNKPDYKVRIYNQPPNPKAIFIPNGADLTQHIGNGAYSADTKQFFFTQCDIAPSGKSHCVIYVSRYENYQWQSAIKLNNAVNDPSSTNTQPFPGIDERGNEILFFVSDRPGGYGGLDIWISKKDKNGNYEAAENVGSQINTPGNEITPFYDAYAHKLYFSSDWHYGFGGYDIFESSGADTNWAEPKNLMQPINTAQNDLYYSLTPDDSKAYITSNRTGSYFIEAETCCNDIYAYANHPKNQKKDSTVTTKSDTTVTVNNEPPKTFIDVALKNVKQKVPVTLYFHNDEPDARSMSDTTSLNYQQTYEEYTSMMGEYENEFAKGLKGDVKEKAQEQVDSFFTEKVDKGYYDLMAFTAELLEVLKAGNTVEVTIKGYCSPLNFSQYNIRLGYRRVASLRNYFYHYHEGALMPYITSGKLKLTNESFGEETASKKISDSRTDTQQSVYSPAASAERRVEIVSVEVK